MVRRRKFLVMSAAGTLAIVGGGAFVLTDRYRGWIHATLQRSLPGYSLQASGLTRFVEEYNARKQGNTRLRLFAAAQRLVDAKPVLPEEMAADFEAEERRIVSDFLIGSDFFDNYPNGPKEITYRGVAEACSPFATF